MFTDETNNEYKNFTALGINIGKPSAKSELKDAFKKRYGSGIAWQEHWAVYKDNGGNKEKLNMTWEQIDLLYESSPYKDKTKVGKILSVVSKNTFKIPLRALMLIFIKMNFFNLATIFMLTKMRKPKEYKQITDKWKNELGGSVNSFEKNVEIGHKKTPKFAKKMNVNWSKTTNFVNAEGSKTVIIPNSVIAGMPPAGALASQYVTPPVVVPPLDKVAWAGIGTLAGGVIATMFNIVNRIAVPLDDSETQTQEDKTPLTKEQLDEIEKGRIDAENDAKEWSMPNWGWWTIGLSGGAIALIILGLTIKTLKDK